jgi:phosphatidylglycerol phospholipase C
MFQKLIVEPRGNALLRDVKKANRSIFLWTVNEESWMKWSIRKEVDGVITDDPKKYLEVCKSYKGEKIHHSLRSWATIIWINMLATVFSLPFRYKRGFTVDVKKGKKS